MNAPRTLLLVNPNTSASVTERLAAEARRVAPSGIAVRAISAASGIPAIQTLEELASSAAAVVAAIAANPDCHGAIVAAFGDPGLDQARGITLFPVVGLAEAGMLGAAEGGRRFSIVTVGEAMRPAVLAKVESLGFTGQLASLRFLAQSVTDVVRDRASIMASVAAAIEDCVLRDKADAVLLGGGPFVGAAHEIAARAAVPVLDGMREAVALAVARMTRAR